MCNISTECALRGEGLVERDARIAELEQDLLSWVMLCDEQTAKLEAEVQKWIERHGDISDQLMMAQSTICEQAQQLAKLQAALEAEKRRSLEGFIRGMEVATKAACPSPRS